MRKGLTCTRSSRPGEITLERGLEMRCCLPPTCSVSCDCQWSRFPLVLWVDALCQVHEPESNALLREMQGHPTAGIPVYRFEIIKYL
ncbi:hypothetical protein BST61_g1935 [Cercospora zeina]